MSYFASSSGYSNTFLVLAFTISQKHVQWLVENNTKQAQPQVHTTLER